MSAVLLTSGRRTQQAALFDSMTVGENVGLGLREHTGKSQVEIDAIVADTAAFFATHAIDIGAITPFFYNFRERDGILDLFEAACGARLTYSYITVGGVTDPQGQPVTITIESIFQDEPTDTFGDGGFCPDGGGVSTDTAGRTTFVVSSRPPSPTSSTSTSTASTSTTLPSAGRR